MPQNPIQSQVVTKNISTFARPSEEQPQMTPQEGGAASADIGPGAAGKNYAVAAQAFGSLSQTAAALSKKYKDFDDKEAFREGAALRLNSQLTYAELVESGQIDPSQNPWGAAATQEEDGKEAAKELSFQINGEVQRLFDIGDKGIRTVEGFNKVVGEMREKFLQDYLGKDPYNSSLMKSQYWGPVFGAQVAQTVDRTRQWHQRESAQVNRNLQIESLGTSVVALMDGFPSRIEQEGSLEAAQAGLTSEISGMLQAAEASLGQYTARKIVLEAALKGAINSDNPSKALEVLESVVYGQGGENDRLVNWSPDDENYYTTLKNTHAVAIARATAQVIPGITSERSTEIRDLVSEFIKDPKREFKDPDELRAELQRLVWAELEKTTGEKPSAQQGSPYMTYIDRLVSNRESDDQANYILNLGPQIARYAEGLMDEDPITAKQLIISHVDAVTRGTDLKSDHVRALVTEGVAALGTRTTTTRRDAARDSLNDRRRKVTELLTNVLQSNIGGDSITDKQLVDGSQGLLSNATVLDGNGDLVPLVVSIEGEDVKIHPKGSPDASATIDLGNARIEANARALEEASLRLMEADPTLTRTAAEIQSHMLLGIPAPQAIERVKRATRPDPILNVAITRMSDGEGTPEDYKLLNRYYEGYTGYLAVKNTPGGIQSNILDDKTDLFWQGVDTVMEIRGYAPNFDDGMDEEEAQQFAVVIQTVRKHQESLTQKGMNRLTGAYEGELVGKILPKVAGMDGKPLADRGFVRFIGENPDLMKRLANYVTTKAILGGFVGITSDEWWARDMVVPPQMTEWVREWADRNVGTLDSGRTIDLQSFGDGPFVNIPPRDGYPAIGSNAIDSANYVFKTLTEGVPQERDLGIGLKGSSSSSSSFFTDVTAEWDTTDPDAVPRLVSGGSDDPHYWGIPLAWQTGSPEVPGLADIYREIGYDFIAGEHDNVGDLIDIVPVTVNGQNRFEIRSSKMESHVYGYVTVEDAARMIDFGERDKIDEQVAEARGQAARTAWWQEKWAAVAEIPGKLGSIPGRIEAGLVERGFGTTPGSLADKEVWQ